MADYYGEQPSQKSGVPTALIIVGVLVALCCFASLGIGGLAFFLMGGAGQVGAAAISDGQSVTGRIGVTNPEDRWTFQGYSGDYVTISMEATDSSFDSYLYLLDPNGNQITYDDDGGDGLNSLISIVLPSNGTYTIIATHYGQSIGGYRLTLRIN